MATGETKLTLRQVIECLRDKGGYFRQIGISKNYRLYIPSGIALGYFNLSTYNSLVMNYSGKIEKVEVDGYQRTQWKEIA